MHASEDIQIILESWMNSEKWHTGLICVSKACNKNKLLLQANSTAQPPLQASQEQELKIPHPLQAS